jgi:radical SAM-linked protein
MRVRIRFCKEGDLRLISHRDLVRTLERLFRRSGIAVAQSEGFHPKPRMMFPSALALGIAGLDEVMDVDLTEEMDPQQLISALTHLAPGGLRFKSAEQLAPTVRKAQAKSLCYELPLPSELVPKVAMQVESLRADSACAVRRSPDKPPIELHPQLEELVLADGVLRMRFRVVNEAALRPRDVLELLGLGETDYHDQLTRTAVELEP